MEMLEALKKRYEAQIAEAVATINIYTKNSVGIGEHPQHLDEVDKLIAKIAEAEAVAANEKVRPTGKRGCENRREHHNVEGGLEINFRKNST